MTGYRISFRDSMNEHKGYEYTGSERRAKSICAAWRREGGKASYDKIELIKVKKGILSALNQYGGHADNG